MTGLSLIARFPLGVYYGHQRDRSTDLAPSPARLHSALVNAASQGSHSVDGQPSDESLEALRWLEQNPPDELLQPDSILINGSSSRFIHRNVSSINKKHSTEERLISDGVAVAGEFGYRWNEAPDEVAKVINNLASDIGCLGEAHSIAVVEAQDFDANLTLDSEANAFSPGTAACEVALPGRTDELIANYKAGFGKKAPTVANDKFKTSELPLPPPLSQRNLTDALYKPTTKERDIQAPWTEAYFFALNRSIPKNRRVELATAMHRALISYVGSDVSPLITGKYISNDVPRPANRLAIQYLPAALAAQFKVDSPALVLFVPRGASAVDLAQIHQSFKIRKLWGRNLGRVTLQFTGIARYGDEFWSPPEEGMKRFWKPLSPVIPETRRVSAGEAEWTLADSGLLSLAYVWREEFATSEKGQLRYLDLRDQVLARGVEVHGARTLSVRGSDFVHRTHRSVPTQPYDALFDLGDLANSQTAVMVGQSRHLGGGLLAPFDVRIDESSSDQNGSNE